MKQPSVNHGPIFSPGRAAFQMFLAHYVVGPYYYFFKQLSVSGRENVPQNKPLIIVSNHLSNFDPPIACIASDRNTCFVAKKELFENRYLTWLITLLGAIYIDRQKPSHSTIKKIKKAIQAGWCVSIFIEGTRSKVPGSLGPPHTGAAYFAISNKLPILPIGLIGTEKKGKCYARIGTIIEPGPDLETTTWEIMRSLSELTGYKLPADHKIATIQERQK
jgi:1-acyl-sn-glycerol-3-phosphate acyltransferase